MFIKARNQLNAESNKGIMVRILADVLTITFASFISCTIISQQIVFSDALLESASLSVLLIVVFIPSFLFMGIGF